MVYSGDKSAPEGADWKTSRFRYPFVAALELVDDAGQEEPADGAVLIERRVRQLGNVSLDWHYIKLTNDIISGASAGGGSAARTKWLTCGNRIRCMHEEMAFSHSKPEHKAVVPWARRASPASRCG